MVGNNWREQIAKIKIAGWQKLSLLDYPGKMAAVIFLAGCNMRCHYCHNHHIWDEKQNTIPFEMVLAELRRRQDWLNAVVVSGGEPTLSPFLIPMLRALRGLGLLIKLDTNGTQPAIVQKVVDMGLVDYVALDIKAPAGKYIALTGMVIDKVLLTAEYLKIQEKVPYMFRTTVSPLLDEKDLLEMGKKIVNGAMCWQIQQCRVENAYSSEKIMRIVDLVKKYARYIVVKGV